MRPEAFLLRIFRGNQGLVAELREIFAKRPRIYGEGAKSAREFLDVAHFRQSIGTCATILLITMAEGGLVWVFGEVGINSTCSCCHDTEPFSCVSVKQRSRAKCNWAKTRSRASILTTMPKKRMYIPDLQWSQGDTEEWVGRKMKTLSRIGIRFLLAFRGL